MATLVLVTVVASVVLTAVEKMELGGVLLVAAFLLLR